MGNLFFDEPGVKHNAVPSFVKDKFGATVNVGDVIRHLSSGPAWEGATYRVERLPSFRGGYCTVQFLTLPEYNPMRQYLQPGVTGSMMPEYGQLIEVGNG